ncbi:hypothetical protein V6U90_01910 [Micromonospora sp. CPCC 206060]|uniref:hypothetical protein n=1 Tax=Micromonospora sp. CPCC 206060 TaxID=3122406 RepID=UPI002FF2AC86
MPASRNPRKSRQTRTGRTGPVSTSPVPGAEPTGPIGVAFTGPSGPALIGPDGAASRSRTELSLDQPSVALPSLAVPADPLLAVPADPVLDQDTRPVPPKAGPLVDNGRSGGTGRGQRTPQARRYAFRRS